MYDFCKIPCKSPLNPHILHDSHFSPRISKNTIPISFMSELGKLFLKQIIFPCILNQHARVCCQFATEICLKQMHSLRVFLVTLVITFGLQYLTHNGWHIQNLTQMYNYPKLALSKCPVEFPPCQSENIFVQFSDNVRTAV